MGGNYKHYHQYLSMPFAGKKKGIKRGEILEMGVCFGCGESNTEDALLRIKEAAFDHEHERPQELKPI